MVPRYYTIHLANTLWSYSTLSYDPGEAFLSTLTDRFVLHLGEATPQEIANIVWAIASLGYALRDRHMAPIGAELARRVSGDAFSAQELTNIVWALSVMGQFRGPHFALLWRATLDKVSDIDQPGKKLAQLFHSTLLLQAQAEKGGADGTDSRANGVAAKAGKGGRGRGSGSGSKWVLPEGVRELAEQSWHAVALRETIFSRFHGQVSFSLSRLKVDHEVERLTKNRYASLIARSPLLSLPFSLNATLGHRSSRQGRMR